MKLGTGTGDLWNLNPTLQERAPKQINFAWEDVAKFHKSLDFLVGVGQGRWYIMVYSHTMAWVSPTIRLIKEATTKTLRKNNTNRMGHIGTHGTPSGTPLGTPIVMRHLLTAGVARPESLWWWRAIAAAAVVPGMRRFGISIGGWENAMRRISWWCRRTAWVECELLLSRWARKMKAVVSDSIGY